jgi:hypothetical protein
MTDKAINPLRRRLIEDMAIRRLGPEGEDYAIQPIPRRPASGGTA